MSPADPQDHLLFSLPRSKVVGRILIPKYYDPELAEAAELARGDYLLPRLGELLLPGDAGSRLGTWIRREHYGTGTIPFVRTSDLRGGFQNSFTRRPATRKRQAAWSRDWTTKPSRS